MTNILEIKNLRTYLQVEAGTLKAVHDVSLDIPRGEVTALVGESGCGKSMTALSILRLVPDPPGKVISGEILFHSKKRGSIDLLTLPEEAMREIRGDRIAMIFQEPMTSLNPVFTIGDQICEAILLHQKVGKNEARERAIAMLKKVGIANPEGRIDDYPHQMSGGMRQRVMIAMALSCNPELLIADEPTTALDVTIQAQILDLLRQLIEEMGMSLLLITHDFGIVAEQAKNVAVMYAGQIVEKGGVKEIFAHPKHPYTKGLLESIPGLQKKGEKRLKAIPGMVPNLAKLPRGCSFAERCERVHDDCRQITPPLLGNGDHRARCYYPY
ncbi:MAG: ABC transporter ATP-binding protein [Deltaproteobacteria bacterium]|nr:ABC transporter ATP-binding protein [Deltaproteobacteria bacterium]